MRRLVSLPETRIITPSSGAPVAQLDRASASEAEGCGFKSRRVYHFYAVAAFHFSSNSSVNSRYAVAPAEWVS